MQATRQSGTKAELRLRRELSKLGLHYTVNKTVLSGLRSQADVIFSSARVVVFVDGCFWHGCPWHGTSPKSNASWWKAKLQENRKRDARTNLMLRKAGWLVLRVWEHLVLLCPEKAARKIADQVARRL
jgi:DNA mismatch endonuclease (patch repair protein)